MHELIMKLGYIILTFFRSIDMDNVLDALSITGTGWLGIFIVTGIIIGVVYLLGLISNLLPREEE